MFDIRNTYIFIFSSLVRTERSGVKRYCFCTQFNTKIYRAISEFGVMIWLFYFQFWLFLQVLKWEITEILMSLAEVIFSEFDIFFRFILW